MGDRCGVHELRHTSATLLLGSGVDEPIIYPWGDRLGDRFKTPDFGNKSHKKSRTPCGNENRPEPMKLWPAVFLVVEEGFEPPTLCL